MRVLAAGFAGLFIALITGTITGLTTNPAAAQTADKMSDGPSGYYVSGGVGANFAPDATFSGTGIDTEAQFDTGFAVSGAVGYDAGNNFRAEFGLDYGTRSVDALSGSSTGTGDASAASLMLNGYYDFRNATPFWPYVGAGIGGALVSYDSVNPVGGSTVDDDDTVFAYQGIAGLRIRVTDSLAMFGDYRYFATSDPGLTTAGGTSVDGEYSEHRVLFGLTWSFGGTPRKPTDSMRGGMGGGTPEVMEPKPEPPKEPLAEPVEKMTPPPQAKLTPAPEPDIPVTPAGEGSFRIFFDWNKASLNRQAQKGIDFIVSKIDPDSVINIHAEGHADRSGTQEFNLALSRLRAQAVRTELVRQGVPAEWINITWKGESEPLVPTPDGMREAKNRRVEIFIKEGKPPANQKLSSSI